MATVYFSTTDITIHSSIDIIRYESFAGFHEKWLDSAFGTILGPELDTFPGNFYVLKASSNK